MGDTITTDDQGFTVITSVAGSSTAAANVLKMTYAFHHLVSWLKGADPGKGRLVWIPDDAIGVSPPTWWDAKVVQQSVDDLPFKCHRKAGLKWYRQPVSTASFSNASPAGDNGEMDVYSHYVEPGTQTMWFLVYRGGTNGSIWVKAVEVAE